jgi:hypothetical protein
MLNLETVYELQGKYGQAEALRAHCYIPMSSFHNSGFMRMKSDMI